MKNARREKYVYKSQKVHKAEKTIYLHKFTNKNKIKPYKKAK